MATLVYRIGDADFCHEITAPTRIVTLKLAGRHQAARALQCYLTPAARFRLGGSGFDIPGTPYVDHNYVSLYWKGRGDYVRDLTASEFRLLVKVATHEAEKRKERDTG